MLALLLHTAVRYYLQIVRVLWPKDVITVLTHFSNLMFMHNR